MDIRLVLVTFPTVEKAQQIGKQMVEAQLAACVNVLPGVTSIYRWQGAVEEDREALAIFKTTADALAALEQALAAAHPYEVPEVVALTPAAVREPYAQWVRSAVGAG
jgi:periplasmic divalent cation tolerance protein